MGFWPTDAVDCWLIPKHQTIGHQLTLTPSQLLREGSWERRPRGDRLYMEVSFYELFLWESIYMEVSILAMRFDENEFSYFLRFVLIPMDFLYAWFIPFRRWQEDKKEAWLILAEHFDKLRDLDLWSGILDFGFLRNLSRQDIEAAEAGSLVCSHNNQNVLRTMSLWKWLIQIEAGTRQV